LISAQTASRTIKKTQTVSRRLADIYRRQAVHGKTQQNLAHAYEPPGSSGLTARRFLGRNPKIAKKTQLGIGFMQYGLFN